MRLFLFADRLMVMKDLAYYLENALKPMKPQGKVIERLVTVAKAYKEGKI